MRKVFTLGSITIFAAYASIAAAADLKFGPDNPKGLLIKPAVSSDMTNLLLVPVDLERRTFGTPFELKHYTKWRVNSATNRTKETSMLYFAGYALEPGDYAVLGFNSDMTQAFRRAQHWICYARAAEVISIRAGEATVWEAGRSEEAYKVQLRRVELTAADLPEFQPKAINARPTAYVNFVGDEPSADPQDCSPTAFEVIDPADVTPALLKNATQFK